MEKKEWDMIISEEDGRDLRALTKDKSTEEIDSMTTEIVACTDDIKRRYQIIKGTVCDLMTKPTDLEKLLKKIRKDAAAYWDFECGSVDHRDYGDAVEIISASREDAIATFHTEADALRGMLSSWQEYCQDVAIYCNIYLKAVFGRRVCAMKLPEPLIGRRCEDGGWDLSACRKRFVSMMLCLIDHHDAGTMPFRTSIAPTFVEEKEARFPYFDIVVNRKALIDLLKELYAIDEDTAERLEEEYDYFVEVAHAFINVAARVMTPKGHAVFFAHYGIEDGTRKSLAELAEKYGVTRERIRQLIDKESRKLKNPLHLDTILLRPDSEADD